MTFDRGSSPLARGLRDGASRRAAAARIIPARAGFTYRAHARSPFQGDHPRSRGVYMGVRSHKISSEGSSPLARGLPLARPGY